MARISAYAAHDWEWLVVSSRRPCSVCGGADTCHRASEGGFARCVRRPSDWPIVGGGWVHRLTPEARPLGALADEKGDVRFPRDAL